MSKPIFLTSEYVNVMVEEFRKNLSEAKMTDGKITFTKSFDYSGADDTKAQVLFKPMAYVKMLSLLRHFDSEVAWHGTVERADDDKFIITDIIVYPQEVTGATVNTDQEEYQKWTMTLDDACFNAMRMQGHSHVNMGTSPSSVDTNHQQQILAQLKGNDYYIFMIFNKRLEHTIKIYDYANNVMYEDKDIVVGVADEGFDDAAFLKEADKAVKRKTYTAASVQDTYPGSYTGGYYRGRSYAYGSQDTYKNETGFASKSSSGVLTKAEDKAEEKGKRGRSTKTDKKNKRGASQVNTSEYPKYFGGENAIVDWDREIFGGTHIDT